MDKTMTLLPNKKIRLHRKSPIDGSMQVMDLACTKIQLEDYYLGHDTIENLFPYLTSSELNFIANGIIE